MAASAVMTDFKIHWFKVVELPVATGHELLSTIFRVLTQSYAWLAWEDLVQKLPIWLSNSGIDFAGIAHISHDLRPIRMLPALHDMLQSTWQLVVPDLLLYALTLSSCYLQIQALRAKLHRRRLSSKYNMHASQADLQ